MDTAILAARAHRAHSTTIDNLKALAPEGELTERVETLGEVFTAPHALRDLESYLLSEQLALVTTLLVEKQATTKKSKAKV